MVRAPHLIARLALLATLLLSAARAGAQDAPVPPDSPAGRQFSAFLGVLRDGREEAVRAFVQGSMNDEFKQLPMEAHLRMFRQLGQDLARAPIRSIRAVDPHQVEVTFGTAAGPLVLELAVEPGPPHRVAGLGARPPEEAPVAVLAEADVNAVVDTATAVLERLYVSPDTGRAIAAHVRARRDAGAYRGLTDPKAFTAALTGDLRALNGDGHLSARVSAGGSRPGPGGLGTGPLDPGAGGYRYIQRAEILEGNVGYLKFGGFAEQGEAYDEVVRALRQMERTGAMIIDVRGAPGGSARLVNFVISHFTEPGLLSLAIAQRDRPDTTWRRTLDSVPGPRRTAVPLFVLVDSGSASASEDMPFVLQGLGRATVVGERTAGAARNNRIVPVGRGILLSVSVSRVWDPCTGREWERTGVTPDIAVPSAQALDAALRAARDPARRATPAAPAACRRATR